jgi:hypothetical protein
MTLHSLLSRTEVDAVLAVIDERLAGDARDLRDALGLKDVQEAVKMMNALDRAKQKLRGGP